MPMKVRYNVVNGQVVSENRGGVKSFFVPDALGSTIAITDQAGAVTDRIGYWPYGGVASRTGSTPAPFQFNGSVGYFADGSDRLYVRKRYLSTALAKWLTVDPAFSDDNLYSYCGENPTRYSDPSGLKFQFEGDDSWREKMAEMLMQIATSGPAGNRLITDLLKSPDIIIIWARTDITRASTSPNPTLIDLLLLKQQVGSGVVINPNSDHTSDLAHELWHAWLNAYVGLGIPREVHEMFATIMQNVVTADIGGHPTYNSLPCGRSNVA